MYVSQAEHVIIDRVVSVIECHKSFSMHEEASRSALALRSENLKTVLISMMRQVLDESIILAIA
jgi:hypothetical protein